MLEDDYSRELNRLLEACECDVAVPSEWQQRLNRRGVIPPIEGDRRAYIRHYFNVRAVLEYGQTLPGIPRQHTTAQVLTRDLAREGIGFFHAEQLFPGERVSLWLSSGKRLFEIVRCVQHNESCFEIGAVVVAESASGNSATAPPNGEAG
jgi:hypothetical protein